jgi:tRNA(adenine34) deaminase
MMDDHAFMGEALALAERALSAGEFPVGCVMACGGRVVTRGGRRGSAGEGLNELDHAEMVALRGLYASGTLDPGEVSVFCTMEPCLMCFSALVLHRIGRVVYAFEDPMGGGANGDRERLRPLYRDSPIVVQAGLRRAEALRLFKTFFSDPRNRYWRGSHLARYTLEQRV